MTTGEESSLQKAHIQKLLSSHKAEYYRNLSIGFLVATAGWFSLFLQSAVQNTKSDLPFIYAICLIIGCIVLGWLSSDFYKESQKYGTIQAEYESFIVYYSMHSGGTDV
ncbi:hypothetical protein [Vibrio parahaemolyticus]|uniref:hypothetical protein n=1 Tax=Vibrio parahaemolyticus TaxID=670 RepID=UPI000B51D568|nr:hypothetical protein [Vibrio parahaemolyticus]EGQ9176165.1 hypothetical protein [Vibrio parahaemolyticus]EGR0911407.1 hypothetical protein [Vibrio parahaemolyticus]EGR1878469.1 hypothetical protein [Vibrio parahaemolyticus]EGR2251742.1 hypothetical protein [Vibrio parahaemolyticus]EGR5255634.1 hypothetical protein [Vibrio parahaemolyticus]